MAEELQGELAAAPPKLVKTYALEPRAGAVVVQYKADKPVPCCLMARYGDTDEGVQFGYHKPQGALTCFAVSMPAPVAVVLVFDEPVPEDGIKVYVNEN